MMRERTLVFIGFVQGLYLAIKRLPFGSGTRPLWGDVLLSILSGVCWAAILVVTVRLTSARASKPGSPPDETPPSQVFELTTPEWEFHAYLRKLTAAERQELQDLRKHFAEQNHLFRWGFPLAILLSGWILESPWNWIVGLSLGLLWLFGLRSGAVGLHNRILATLDADLSFGEVEFTQSSGNSTKQESLRGSGFTWTEAKWRRDPQEYLKHFVQSQLWLHLHETLEKRLCNLMVVEAKERTLSLKFGSEIQISTLNGSLQGIGSPLLAEGLRQHLTAQAAKPELTIDGKPCRVDIHFPATDAISVQVTATGENHPPV